MAVTAVTHAYVWYRMVHQPRWLHARLATLLLACLATLLPLGMLGLLYMRVLPRAIAQPLMALTFTYAGILYFLLLALVLLDLVGMRAARRKAWIALMACVSLSAAAIGQALRPVLAHTEHVRIEGWPSQMAGYRIVQLSDMHVGPTIGLAAVKAIVEETNRQRPDLVVVTGDLVDGSPAALAPLLAPLRALVARDGVYMVLGNHEHLSDVTAWSKVLPSLGLRVLRNESVTIREAFELVGIDDLRSLNPDGRPAADLDEAFAHASPASVKIALSHEPAALAALSDRHAALVLAGHTHGGQVVPLQLAEKWDQGYVVGRYDHRTTQMYVSPGAGYWGPPMRMGTRAEVSVIVVNPR